MGEIHHLLETGMMLCFGLSWPASILKSWRSRTSKGKSLPFLVLIFSGYIMGLAGKVIIGQLVWHVIGIYTLNATLVGIDLALYFRNKGLDAQRDARTGG